jgi:hypothetical protein
MVSHGREWSTEIVLDGVRCWPRGSPGRLQFFIYLCPSVVVPSTSLAFVTVYRCGYGGGLGEKMEDWVELMHQIGRARVRFRTTKDLKARAKARARTVHSC